MIRMAWSIPVAAALAACGQHDSGSGRSSRSTAPAARTQASASSSTAAMGAASTTPGEVVYAKTCALCHGTGVAGAPKVGDKEEWQPRIAQGKEVLYRHALQGYTGSKGAMPPRGGIPTLPDADVKAAVDFMVAKAQ